MRGVVLDEFDAPVNFRIDLAEPAPGDGELLVRVHAASVNPVDNAILAGMLRGVAEHQFPVVLGRDFAGVVEQVGSGLSDYAPGAEVFGFVPAVGPTVHHGSFAELIVVDAGLVAPIPAGLPMRVAGVLPLAGITAKRAVDALSLRGDETVLVVGATGGVGSFAVQLAARAGAYVLATASHSDRDYMRSLGAAEFVLREGDHAAILHAGHGDGVDAVIDLVSHTPESFAIYAAALKHGGVASSPLRGVGDGPGRFPIVATPDPGVLTALGELLSAGALTAPIHAEYELRRVGDALGALRSSHKRGKLAVRVI